MASSNSQRRSRASSFLSFIGGSLSRGGKQTGRAAGFRKRGAMRRETTNAIRTVLEEVLPPFVRDSAAMRWLFRRHWRSEEHTSELQSLMRISYAVFCLKKKNTLRAERIKDSEHILLK